MAVKQTKTCQFVTYFSEEDFLIEIEIKFDENQWKGSIKPKLDDFYFDYYLPELHMKTKLLKTGYFSFKNNEFF